MPASTAWSAVTSLRPSLPYSSMSWVPSFWFELEDAGLHKLGMAGEGMELLEHHSTGLPY